MTEKTQSSTTTSETFVVSTAFVTHKTSLSKGIELVPLLQRTRSLSFKSRDGAKVPIGEQSTRVKRGPSTDQDGMVDCESVGANEHVKIHKTDNRQVSLLTDGVMTTHCPKPLTPNDHIDHTETFTNNDQVISGVPLTDCHFSLPLWVDSSQGPTLSPDLFQPCTDDDSTEEIDYPTPSTKTEKESRRNVRQKKIDSMKKIEQTEQRRSRFLKRQKRLDADDGTTDNNNSSNLSPSKSKKKVMWEEGNNLFEFHIYSPVAVEDREVTPIIS